MLFLVKMDVDIPAEFDAEKASQLKLVEKSRFQELQRSGKWRHIWRVVGQYANVSIFDVDSNAELHDLLVTLPLYPFMTVTVRPLCRHPSSIYEDDR
ncbi:muconolactone Delta-isomerase [Acetobacter cerevisiae]|uniref:Muconolactone Delta-isomerase n=1 Tax=Acetobacter cerevisiae TaxID=178900 RepID=A0A149UUC8_9PROT|nr:muconolactone Delta-isomerase [Acetobacter cerevisiae]KXV71521.1 muconolactone delta-isomerase [Acetobacter cerevisiae]MCP1246639.1 muconolactone Delta-isomerase [Acetobacter cerevisiae]MCP1256178.1 muconolactone Delta-isomerase [Acetobacter cerevisiae]